MAKWEIKCTFVPRAYSQPCIDARHKFKDEITRYNKFRRIALGKGREKSKPDEFDAKSYASAKTKKNWILRQREPTPFENNLLIDVSSIKPDPKIIEEYEAKIKEVFPDASLN